MARPDIFGFAPATTTPARPIGFPFARSASTVTDRDLALLFFQVLSQPPEAGRYYLGRRLAELFPHRALIETHVRSFDVEVYAADGHCLVTDRRVPPGQRLTSWSAPTGQISHPAHHIWLEVRWGGERLDVIITSWEDMRHAVILAGDHDTADRFLAAVCRWNTKPREETITVFAGDDWCSDRLLFRAIKRATLETLVLRPGVKAQLLEDVTSFFDARETYERYAVPWRRGILLLGPPGNGKTHAVKALVNAVDRPCLYVRSFRAARQPDEVNMRHVFARARVSAPCILVLEDLDALVTDKSRSFFLNELDGFESNEGILTLATTNHPERLDPAIINRPSRFDRKYTFDLPGRPERDAFIAAWNERLEPELRLSPAGVQQLADATDGFSFAYLKELMVSASVRWMAVQQPGSMDQIVVDQVDTLRAEMAELPDPALNKREPARRPHGCCFR
jgi:hypothetical protein